MIFGTESSQSRSHVIIKIIQSVLVGLLSKHLIKFGFYLELWVFSWPIHSVFPHLTHLTRYCLHYRVGKASIYKLESYSGFGINLCFVHLLKYEVIIIKYHLVTKSELLVTHNQTSSLVKLGALLLVLVKVYWLDNKNLPLVCH